MRDDARCHSARRQLAARGPPGVTRSCRARDVTVAFGDKTGARQVSTSTSIAARSSASSARPGAGKSVLMRTILGLSRKQSGTIEVFGHDLRQGQRDERLAHRPALGVLFQHGALFSSLTVQENIQVPMREYLDLSHALMDELARLKIELVGLPPRCGGQVSVRALRRHDQARRARPGPGARPGNRLSRRADIRPRPDRRADFDELICTLRDTLGLTVYMVTHDLDSLFSVCDRIAVLGDERVLVEGTIEDMLASTILGEVLFPRQAGASDRARGPVSAEAKPTVSLRRQDLT